jgi:hypothetical protein
MTNVVKFPKGHDHSQDKGEPCLTCEILSLINRFDEKHHHRGLTITEILNALVECTATVVVVAAQQGYTENLAHIVANDVEHVVRQMHAFGVPHRV